jgi:dsDNA-specific endonuclease/ATPase MutS2
MKIGDKVLVLDDTISGVIIRFNLDKVLVMTGDDFEMEFHKNELIVMNNPVSKRDFIPQDFSQILSEKEIKKNQNTKRVKPKERMLPPMEVDLHIHQLVDKSKGLSNYEMLNIQMDTAKRQLDFAIKKRIQRVVFIHGIGEGVLRAELEFLFRQYGNLQYNDADFQKYGRGATEVYIFQNTKPEF